MYDGSRSGGSGEGIVDPDGGHATPSGHTVECGETRSDAIRRLELGAEPESVRDIYYILQTCCASDSTAIPGVWPIRGIGSCVRSEN